MRKMGRKVDRNRMRNKEDEKVRKVVPPTESVD